MDLHYISEFFDLKIVSIATLISRIYLYLAHWDRSAYKFTLPS